MPWPPALNLLGLSAEIVGALFLAVGAIGLDRLDHTRGLLTVLASRMSSSAGPKFRPGSLEGVLAFLSCLACTMVVTFAAGALLERYRPSITTIPGGLLLLGLGTGLAAGGTAVLASQLFIWALKSIAALCRRLVTSEESRTAGIIGYALLVVGFCLQFAANALQMAIGNEGP